MPTVHFTSHLEGYAPCEPIVVNGTTVSVALKNALADHDQLRSYVFDEQGRLRRHMVVFIDGQIVTDRVQLSDQVGPDTDIYVMQALSGG